jgi:inosine-uridine nucleoside N-ribohydrolase
MPPPIKLLLDTDVGTDVDDALAIGLALASPEIELRAVTTVSGDVRLRGRIAKKLLTLAGRADVPVAAGVREPVLRQRSFLWFGHEGRGILNNDEDLPLAATHGVDLMIDAILSDRPHVIAIGPLSNLAVAIMKEPAIIEAISHLTVMGGALGRAPGIPPLEYNLGSDAEAALVVLNAGMPTTLVPLDVTWHVALAEAHLARLRRSRSLLVRTLCDAIEVWAPLQRAFFAGMPGFEPATVALLHDPLTVGVVIERSFVTFERLRLRPTLVDGAFRFVDEADAPELEVAVSVDAARFVEFMLQRLERLT